MFSFKEKREKDRRTSRDKHQQKVVSTYNNLIFIIDQQTISQRAKNSPILIPLRCLPRLSSLTRVRALTFHTHRASPLLHTPAPLAECPVLATHFWVDSGAGQPNDPGHIPFRRTCASRWASQVALVVKRPPASAGNITGVGLIPGLGRSPGEGHGNPVQCSCLENPMDRGAWRAAVHGVAKSRTQRPSRWWLISLK